MARIAHNVHHRVAFSAGIMRTALRRVRTLIKDNKPREAIELIDAAVAHVDLVMAGESSPGDQPPELYPQQDER